MNWEHSTEPFAGDPITDFRLSTLQDALPSGGLDAYWWTALIDLRAVSMDDLADQLSAAFPAQAPGLVFPNVYSATERAVAPDSQVVTAFIRTHVLDRLNVDGDTFGVASVQAGILVADRKVAAAASQLTSGPRIDVPEGTVLTAVIDDGIAVAHNLFRSNPLHTRVEHAFIMDADGSAEGHTHGEKLDKRQIDALIAENTYNGLLDEPAFYAQAGVIDHSDRGFSPVMLSRSHGTHVLALAAGYEMGAAPETRPILCAALPSRVTEDPTGSNLEPSLALALLVLSHQARRYRLPDGSRPPLVVNFSYGNFSGPHDGTSPISRLLEDWLNRDTEQTTRILLPAGNGNLSQTHAVAEFSPKESERVSLRLEAQPEDRTASHVEMWLPFTGSATPPPHVSVRVTAPSGARSKWISPQKRHRAILRDHSGTEIARLTYRLEPFPTCRGVFVLSLRPTASLNRRQELAPSGGWRIDIKNKGIANSSKVNIWVRRDETLPGFPPHGRQAYFNNACYQKFDTQGAPLAVDPVGSDCPVRRAGTLSGFATGPSPMVIAGLTQSTGLLPDYSAAGPITATRDAPNASRDGADASARSDDSPVLIGVLSAGSNSGSLVRLSGTSVSSPSVARYIADSLAEGEASNRDWLCRQASRQDARFPTPKPKSTRSGCGRLDLPNPPFLAPRHRRHF